jgi:thiamine transport system substrate-binding protein
MKKLILFVSVIALLISSCAPSAAATVTAGPTAAPGTTQAAPTQTVPAGMAVLTVMTHDSFSVTADLITQFDQQNHVQVNFIKAGDAGTMLNRAILTKNAPQADVMYGVDNTFLSRALDAGIYEPYVSPLLKDIPDAFKLDNQNMALPVDYGDVCINYDKAYFAEKKLTVPQTLDDLLKPDYKGMLAMENPATSSPGLAFIMATIAHFGPQKYLDYWKSLRANGLVTVNDWETAYYTNFSGSSGKGAQPLVVSYASSPAAEVVYSKTPLTDSPTGSLLGDGMCFRQIEFVGILKGTKNRALAEKFVDFMLGKIFQEDMPLQMYVYPVIPNVTLPAEFVKYAQVPAHPETLDPAQISKNRDQWIQDWTNTVLK